MGSYILVHRKDVDKRWWNDLVKTCAVVGDTFEIHCWSDETAEIMAALRYGQKVKTSWSGGTVIRGRITREFLSFLTETKKPTDTEIYNISTVVNIPSSLPSLLWSLLIASSIAVIYFFRSFLSRKP